MRHLLRILGALISTAIALFMMCTVMYWWIPAVVITVIVAIFLQFIAFAYGCEVEDITEKIEHYFSPDGGEK